MLKMTVRPLAIRNSSIPYSTPLSVDMTISSSTTHHRWKVGAACSPRQCGSKRQIARDQSVFSKNQYRSVCLKRRTISRPCHLAGGRQDSLRSLDRSDHLPAPTGIFLVERLALGQFAERLDVHRLEKLVIILPHVALPAVIDFKFHAFERQRDLQRFKRLGLVRRRCKHPHFVDWWIEHSEAVF